jgi:hypothetical protein
MSVDVENEKTTDAALELRLRRMWKDDISAAYRGQVNDVLSHVESRVRELVTESLQTMSGRLSEHDAKTQERRRQHDTETRECLRKNDDRVKQHIDDAERALEHQVANIVVKILAEYGVVSSFDNQVIKYN